VQLESARHAALSNISAERRLHPSAYGGDLRASTRSDAWAFDGRCLEDAYRSMLRVLMLVLVLVL